MVSKPIDTAGNPKPIMPLIMPAKANTTIIIARNVTVYLRFLQGYATEKNRFCPILVFRSGSQLKVEAVLYFSSNTLLKILSIIHTRYKLLNT